METIEKDAAKTGAGCALPVGVFHGGQTHASFTLSKVTGRDRKDIAEADVLRNGGRVITTLLRNCLTSLGDLEGFDDPAVRTRWLKNALSADRTFLLLQLRRASLGPKMQMEAKCSACGEKNEFESSIDDLKVNGLPDGCRVEESANGFTIERGFDVEGVGKVVMRYTNGADEEAITPLVKSNPVEASMATLARCLVSIEGKGVNRAELDDMELGKLDAIQAAWEKGMPGVDMTYTMKCWSCAASVRLEMNALDFLFPSRRTAR